MSFVLSFSYAHRSEVGDGEHDIYSAKCKSHNMVFGKLIITDIAIRDGIVYST